MKKTQKMLGNFMIYSFMVEELELMVVDSGFKIYNSYKTIKKWIAEDAAG